MDSIWNVLLRLLSSEGKVPHRGEDKKMEWDSWKAPQDPE